MNNFKLVMLKKILSNLHYSPTIIMLNLETSNENLQASCLLTLVRYQTDQVPPSDCFMLYWETFNKDFGTVFSNSTTPYHPLIIVFILWPVQQTIPHLFLNRWWYMGLGVW